MVYWKEGLVLYSKYGVVSNVQNNNMDESLAILYIGCVKEFTIANDETKSTEMDKNNNDNDGPNSEESKSNKSKSNAVGTRWFSCSRQAPKK